MNLAEEGVQIPGRSAVVQPDHQESVHSLRRAAQLIVDLNELEEHILGQPAQPFKPAAGQGQIDALAVKEIHQVEQIGVPGEPGDEHIGLDRAQILRQECVGKHRPLFRAHTGDSPSHPHVELPDVGDDVVPRILIRILRHEVQRVFLPRLHRREAASEQAYQFAHRMVQQPAARLCFRFQPFFNSEAGDVRVKQLSDAPDAVGILDQGRLQLPILPARTHAQLSSVQTIAAGLQLILGKAPGEAQRQARGLHSRQDRDVFPCLQHAFLSSFTMVMCLSTPRTRLSSPSA